MRLTEIDGPAFAAYVEKVLVSELEPGTDVILDNLQRIRTLKPPKSRAMRVVGSNSCSHAVLTWTQLFRVLPVAIPYQPMIEVALGLERLARMIANVITQPDRANRMSEIIESIVFKDWVKQLKQAA